MEELTLSEVKRMFKQGLKGLPKGDWIQEEWIDFVDMLYKDGYITLEQNNEYTNIVIYH